MDRVRAVHYMGRHDELEATIRPLVAELLEVYGAIAAEAEKGSNGGRTKVSAEEGRAGFVE